MRVFRLSKAAFSHDLSGRGAERSGGRWNSKGIAMLYTSESRALCTTEIAVHTPLGIVPADYQLITIDIPDEIKISEIKKSALPKDWSLFPHPNSTQLIGDQFIKAGKYLVFKVPSVVVQGDHNFLINPLHKDFGKIKLVGVEPFSFDKRMFMK